jgi:hypothetical protein
MSTPLSFRRRLARWSHTTPARLLAICALFGAPILAVMHVPQGDLRLLQPVKTSGAGGTDHVPFASNERDDCVRWLFDSRTGTYFATREISCGRRSDEVIEAKTLDRPIALRKSLQP